eukprot:GEMP01024029.1.p2 GENE.GEMP01024029.1~~GEMP01024029.1.p2  ORF type:complete len:110 (-),score=7.12 GEMP01024029.1:261-590(-)
MNVKTNQARRTQTDARINVAENNSSFFAINFAYSRRVYVGPQQKKNTQIFVDGLATVYRCSRWKDKNMELHSQKKSELTFFQNEDNSAFHRLIIRFSRAIVLKEVKTII